MRRFLIAAAIALSAAAATTASAGEALAPAIADQLDRQAVEFTASAAKRERMMIIQRNMARQRHGGPGYGNGRGYGPGPGYGGYGRGYGHRPGGPPPYGYGPPRYNRW
jgi:hypothetical protein